MKRFYLILTALLFGVTLQAHATVVPIGDYSYGATELRLWDMYNQLYGTTFTTNSQVDDREIDSQITSGIFEAGEYKVTLLSRWGAADLFLNTYAADDPSDVSSILQSNNGFWFNKVNPQEFTIQPDEDFGLLGEGVWGWNPNNSLGKFYSENELNGSGQPYHFVFLSTNDPDKILVGFEDLRCGDWDYNDAVFTMQRISHTPEPASMTLLGLGLLGLAGIRRKKNA